MKRRKRFLARNWRWLLPTMAIVIDYFLLNLSFILAILIRAGDLTIIIGYTRPHLFMNGMFGMIGLGVGIYRSRYNLSLKHLRFGYKRVILFLAISTMAFMYIIKKGEHYSRAIILLTFLIFYLLVELTHYLLKRWQGHLVNRESIGYRAIIIGTSRWSFKLFQQIADTFGGFYRVIGYVQETGETGSQVYDLIRGSVIGQMERFADIVAIHQPDVVFIATDTMEMGKYRDIYRVCLEKQIRLKMISSHVSHVLNYSHIRDVSGVSLVREQWRLEMQSLNAVLKRAFDLFFVVIIIPLILPLGLLVAIMIKASSRGPVLFKQPRSLCEGGQVFAIYKFRSMVADAEKSKMGLFGRDGTNGALFKLKDDPRITPLGKFLRKLSLDELPQFINVLKGEMSIVGPRPLPVADYTQINAEGTTENLDWYRQRGEVKPGLTGLWQISGRSNISFEDMLYLDLYYIEHQSIFFDLEILFDTVPAVLLGKGAY